MNDIAVITTGDALHSYSGFSGDLFQRFIEYTDREPTTVKGYVTCLRQFAKWLAAAAGRHIGL